MQLEAGMISSHRPRWRVPVAASAIAAVAIILVWAHERASSPTPKLAFETSAVDRGPIRARVTATGTVNPIVQVQVGSQVSGTIQTLGADFNSEVSPGQMVAQIDPRLFKAAVELAQANLLAARATEHKAKATLVDAKRIAARNHELLAQSLIAKATVDTSDTAAETAAADVEAANAAEAQAQAALDSANLNLVYSTIRSPIRGTVITRNVDVGQTVAASFAAPTLFLIGEDLTKMEVDTNIAEADVGALAPGMAATFTVDAFPAKVFRGAIRQVRSSPQIVQNVVTYNAVIDVANPKLELKPGMTANLEIIYADRSDVVRVPNAAIRFRPPPQLARATTAPLGKKLVWVLRAGTPVPVVFEPGVSDGTFTEVAAGLAPGDLVITEVTGAHASTVGRIL
ncbi:MAG TPA: efflux RND transporter periplasmic adaptor subunit [Kofleriaceae bacterium]|nr:efflux RND transporter periplasmic adaptor subunit [Kofleriaceae bacterium]